MTAKGSSLLFGTWYLFVATGCTTPPPTKVNEPPQIAWSTRLAETAKKPLKLTDNTVVLDARSDFDYGLAHWSASIHFTAANLMTDSRKPWLPVDQRTAAQRLALLGVEPKTPVLVIGYGVKGRGEEAQLAWMLLYFGVEDVQTVSVDGLDVYFTHQQTPERKNFPVWDARTREELVMDRAGFIKAAMSPRKNGNISTHIIDVRSKDEYFNKSGKKYETPDLQALNIEWKEFFSEDGRPNKAVRRRLQGVGVKLDDSILVISDKGVRSSAASYALLALGFKHVQNFLNGWESLLAKNGN